MLELKVLCLLVVANGVPVIVQYLLKDRLSAPLDGGYIWIDRRPLLGNSKTVRGVIAALIVTPVAAKLLGIGFFLGLMIGFYAMLGDALASFIKRRRGVEPSSRMPGIDQIPESLLPLVVTKDITDFSWLMIFLLVMVFTVLEVTVSPLLYRLHIRKRPY
ncbi:MAG: CDP-archaeol synthase [Gammaproteobacteria bacterium]|nr:CDP-archaeol synthase [Gammaproteobacteria bacterium]MDH5651644.1 CDP-archaeol synthase [Gammaproteobacteria bacterium]